MAAQRRKEEADAFQLATQQALICAPASPVKSSPQRITTLVDGDGNIDENCYILRLSPEIRGRIYYYALDNDFHASLDPISSRYPDAVKTRSKTPALMRTCSQMRIEASAIWYSQTVFIYRLDKELYNWLQLIGPTNQKLIRTVRRDCISLTKRWAEAYVVFTHARLRDKKLFLAEEAIEVAFWEPHVPAAPNVKDNEANAALVATANAALEMEEQDMPGETFEFDPDLELELENFAGHFLDDAGSDNAHEEAATSSVADSKSSSTSVARCANSSSGDDRETKKPKSSKKSTKSSASSVVGDEDEKKPKKSAKSSASSATEESEKKKEKAEKKKKNSPSSLAESVMSTKSGKGDKTKPKKPVKPKVKKEPEPEKTWAFVRMESVSV